MVRIGVLGAGHLGKIHLRLLKEIPAYELVGFYDPDDKQAEQVAAQFGLHRFHSVDDLIDAVDAVDIVTPTLSHFDCARKALKKTRHIFIEKPIAHTVREARQINDLVKEAGVKAQVGHVERFNPAFLALKDVAMKPMFIESHRLAFFNPRGTDVSVVLDLMIHDIDIILHLVRSSVKKVHASGVAVISDQPDIANARIEFDNGCVANLTASRISMKVMRKMRLFQRDAYISVDFAEKETEIFTLADTNDDDDALKIEVDTGGKFSQKSIRLDKPEILPVNAIQEELTLFARAIAEDTETAVPVSDGFHALEVAHQILEKIQKNHFAQ
ncbi:MAG: Gfo/Idh/MocA family oxidoreductase [Chitinophagales bacterium]|nr:Gfo/Idh/MocA family oxidoreductase [Chitinophagales bacterium]HAE14160.1 oxidoreductase [Bacteroidota bacterium]MCB9021261.1 Gfo/Idh/MocA family oxidoreductase [Chitinophagales bacterium]HAE34418.1 oxidoreductase [Bacteroidota bacterium]HPE96926.1 Gfo/Idh/MocA family oxidoreductase [Chitinophagales bacterium]